MGWGLLSRVFQRHRLPGQQLPVGSPHLSSVRPPVLTSVLFPLWPRICHIIKAIVSVSTSALGFETLGDRHDVPGLAWCLARSRRVRSAVWMPAPLRRKGQELAAEALGPPCVARPPAGTKAELVVRQEGERVRPLI